MTSYRRLPPAVAVWYFGGPGKLPQGLAQVPASDHIRQRIMLEAQRLVAAHDASLKEIAYQLGFDDAAHFSKLFKRCHGVSFSSFKARARQQHAGSVLA